MKNLAIVVFVLMLLCASAAAQTTAFTYQGSLKDGASAANGNYDFEFALFDSLSGGSQQGSTLSRNAVAVANGIFTVSLDFGSTFPGTDRYLEIRVKLAGQPGTTTLSPRQRVNSAPYSVKSINADNATNALQLGGVAANQYVVTTDPRMTDDRTPTAGSGNYIQSNPASTQTGANFNINGFGTANEFDAPIFKGGEYWVNNSPIVQTRGTNNLFVGKDVDFAGAGTNNSIFGQGAGQQNTGDFNSFFGYATGATNAGSYNSSLGGYAGGGMTSTANSNSFFGDRAGEFNSSGSGNTYIGANGSASGGTAGDNNTMLGTNTFLGTNTSNNTILGAFASVGNGSSNNTILGYDSDIPSSASISNSTVIGFYSSVSTSNTIVIGRDTVGTLPMTTTQVRGKFQMLSPANGAAVAGSFELNGLKGLIADHLVFRNLDIPVSPVHLCYRVTPTGGSDGGYGLTGCGALLTSVRNKSDIQPFAGGLDVIKRLRPVTFKWKATGASDAGLNVEDVAEVDPSLVSRDDKGKILDVKENSLNVLFINAFQERQAQIEQQQRQIERQQIQIENLKKMMCLDHKEADVCREK